MIASIIRKVYNRFPKPPEAESVFLAKKKSYSAYQVGEWSYGSPRVLSWNEGASLVIGRFCSIADGVTILLGGDHRIDWVTTYPFNMLFKEAEQFKGHPRSKGDVIIGHDVWIGRDTLILSGVTIGNGAVVAARSVVTRHVSPYSVVGGNPARQIKFRFPEHVIDALQRIAWWDWPLPKIKEALPLLLSSDVEAFLAHYSGDETDQSFEQGIERA